MARSDTNTSWYMPEVAGTVTLGVTYSDGSSFHPAPCTLHPAPYTLLSSQPARQNSRLRPRPFTPLIMIPNQDLQVGGSRPPHPAHTLSIARAMLVTCTLRRPA